MAAIVLPTVETFTIPSLGWTVTDFRNLGHAEKVQSMYRFKKAVLRFVRSQSIKPVDILCSLTIPKQTDDFERGYSEAFLKDPRLDRADYILSHPIERFRFHTGMENRAELLSVSMDGQIIGGVHFAKFTIEIDTTRKLACRSMIWIGVDPIQGRADLDVWMDAITFIIDNDLGLEDGRALDFIGYDFTSDTHLKEGLSDRTGVVEFIDRMADHFNTSRLPDSNGDLHFRRVGAPARR